MSDEKPGYERISITVPSDLAEELRGMRNSEVIESVSAFVTRSVAGQIDRDRRHRESEERLRADFALDDDTARLAQQWADDVTNKRTTLPMKDYIAAARHGSAA